MVSVWILGRECLRYSLGWLKRKVYKDIALYRKEGEDLFLQTKYEKLAGTLKSRV